MHRWLRGCRVEHRDGHVEEAMAAEARALEYHNQGVQDDRIARTLAGLEAIGDHLAGIPGRKSLC